MEPATIYLSGPMTGLADHNFPAFHAAAARLRAAGHIVFNPAESFGGDATRPRAEYMRVDIQAVLDAQAVAVLPGWVESPGANLEVAIAAELGLPVLDAETLDPVRVELVSNAVVPESILDEASRLVMGDRGAAYGHPLDDYERTSAIWTALLSGKLRPGERVTAEEAVLCMIGVKLSREVHRPKRDNRVDAAGYALCLDRIRQERRRRAAEITDAQLERDLDVVLDGKEA